MADQTTFVKLDRNIRYWRWFKNPKTFLVWIWLITSANIEAHDFEQETIKRGEIATSRKSIAVATGLTEDEVRTALKHLKSTGEITSRIRAKYQVITIVEFDKYQNVPSKFPGSSPADPRQVPGSSPQSKNEKNVRRERRKNIFSAPTVDQVLAFAKSEQLPMSQKDAEQFVWYNTAHSWKGITDWQALVRMRASQLDTGADPDQPDEEEDY